MMPGYGLPSYQPNFSGMPSYMPGLSMGLGGLSDIMGMIQNMQVNRRQRQMFDLLRNPEALAANINRMYQPLSKEGQESISRMVQGEMAMRGTADSRYADLASARAFSESEGSRRNAIMNAYLNALTGAGGFTGEQRPLGGLAGSLGQVMQLYGMGYGGQQPRESATQQRYAGGESPYGSPLTYPKDPQHEWDLTYGGSYNK